MTEFVVENDDEFIDVVSRADVGDRIIFNEKILEVAY
jgi:hypothetical protein